MKYFFIIITVAFFSCNQADKPKEQTPVTIAVPEIKAVPEDDTTLSLRKAITAIEIEEITQTSKIVSLTIDSIRHEMISLKDFYSIKKEELVQGIKFSTNKEKTNKALNYLDKIIAASSSKPSIYKVLFHMNALLANNIKYNEGHIKYLKDNLSEIEIIFP